MIWIGTFEEGPNRFDPATGDVTRFRHDPADPTGLPANTVRALREDRDGRMWVGTRGGGLVRLDRRTGRFERFRHDARDPASLAHDDVRALLVDRAGALGVGTNGGGVLVREARRDRQATSRPIPGASRTTTSSSSTRTAPGLSGSGRSEAGGPASTGRRAGSRGSPRRKDCPAIRFTGSSRTRGSVSGSARFAGCPASALARGPFRRTTAATGCRPTSSTGERSTGARARRCSSAASTASARTSRRRSPSGPTRSRSS